MKKIISLLVVLAMVLAMVPAVFAAEADATFTKITSMDELTSGEYVLICDTGVAMGQLDGGWILPANPVVDGDTVTDAAGAVWTLTVDGTNVKLTDANGVTVAPKGGNSNGIKEGDYNWTVSCENGTFQFAGQGSDTVILAGNVDYENKFRGYKSTTVTGQYAESYPAAFSLYKLDEAAAEPELPENGLIIGENEMELPIDATEASVYTFTATETGTLYIRAIDFLYCSSWNPEYSDNTEYWNEWAMYTSFTINGETLEFDYYGSVEVVAGETYTIEWAHLEEDPMFGYKAVVVLSYSDEIMPVVGIDTELMPSYLPMQTVEIPAGESVAYILSYEFSNYVLRIIGENAYVTFEYMNWDTYQRETVRIDAVDGVVEYDVTKYCIFDITIGNDGDTAACFDMECYAPLGSEANPIVLESLDDLRYAAEAGEEFGIYYIWTAPEAGTLTVTMPAEGVWVNVINKTTDEYPSYNDDWTQATLVLAAGDEVMLYVSGWSEEGLEFVLDYTFTTGDEGGEVDPEEPVELFEGYNILNLADGSLTGATGIWTAPEAGTVVFTVVELHVYDVETGDYLMVDPASYFRFNNFDMFVNDVEPDERITATLNVDAGEDVSLVVRSMFGYEAIVVVELTFNAASEGGDEGGEENAPSSGTVDYVADTNPITYTFTATESGVLTIYVSSSNGWEVVVAEDYSSEAFWSDIHTSPVTVNVTAGITYTVYIRGYDEATWFYQDATITYEIVVPGAEVGGGEEGGEDPVENEIVVETTDTFGYFDLYTFTATEAGTYTFYIPAGLGVWSKASYDAWGRPEIDYYDNTDGFELVVDLAEGEEYAFYVAAKTRGTWTITYTVVASEGGGEGGEDTPVEDNYNYQDLIIGNNNVNGADIHWMYTASEAGTLTLNAGVAMFGDVTVTVKVNDGEAQAIVPNSQTVLELQAGDVVKINVFATGYQTITAEWAAAGGEVEDNYNYKNLIIGNNNVNGADIHWMYTASEAGTLTLNAGVAMFGDVTVTVKVNDGEAQAIVPNSQTVLELQAGDVVKINVFATGYQTITAEWAAAGGEDQECEHEFVDGVCIHCGEEDPNYEPPVQEPDGSSSNPFIVEELPYTAEQDATADLYYQWTATEDGILYMTYAGGLCTLNGSSVGSWETMDGGKYIQVAAGDVIIINYWGGTGFTLTFEVPTVDYIILENLNAVTIELNAGETKYYKWIADKDGELTITLDSYTWYGTYMFNAKVNGNDFNYTGSFVLNVQAGEEVVFEFTAPRYAGAGSLVFSGTFPAEHVCEHVITDVQDATCTEDGHVTYTCECGDTYTEVLPATGHTYVDGTCHCGAVDPDYNPETGDFNVLAAVIVAMMSMGAAVLVVSKKRS